MFTVLQSFIKVHRIPRRKIMMAYLTAQNPAPKPVVMMRTLQHPQLRYPPLIYPRRKSLISKLAGAPAQVSPVNVPFVVGLDLASGIGLITNAGLSVGIETGVFSNSYPAGTIFDQDPDAGTPVALLTPINLVVVYNSPLTQLVPRVTGLLLPAGLALLTNFTVTAVTAIKSNLPAGTILAQSLEPGTLAVLGAHISLVTSLGPIVGNNNVIVPQKSANTRNTTLTPTQDL